MREERKVVLAKKVEGRQMLVQTTSVSVRTAVNGSISESWPLYRVLHLRTRRPRSIQFLPLPIET